MQPGHFDVCIFIQDWKGAAHGLPFPKQVFWTGDSYDQYMNFGIGDERVIEKVDRFFAVSNWQANALCAASGYPREQARVVQNGVHLPWFDGEETRSHGKLIFTSSPYRGLALVSRLFAELKNRHPEIELDVFSGLAVYDKEGPFQGPEVRQYEQIKKQLQEQPSCVIHGNVTQQQLAREMMNAGIYFYPNVFVETSCIGAIEAQAAGCPIVTSALGALPETVGEAGFCIPGTFGSDEYNAAFIDATSRLLSDRELWEHCSTVGKQRAQSEFSWEHVADRFELELGELVSG